MLRIYILAGVALVILSVVTGGYFYVSNLQEDLEFAKTELTSVTSAFEQQELVLSELQTQIEFQKVLREELQQKFTNARKQPIQTKKLFAEHDVEKLMRAKKELMTKRMRKATEKVFKELEAETQ